MGLQGGPGDAGVWFRDHQQMNLGRFMDAVQPKATRNGRAETVATYKSRLNALVASFTPHEQAILRRVNIGVPTSDLVTTDFVKRLEGDAAGSASEQRSKRAAYWAARRARE